MTTLVSAHLDAARQMISQFLIKRHREPSLVRRGDLRLSSLCEFGQMEKTRKSGNDSARKSPGCGSPSSPETLAPNPETRGVLGAYVERRGTRATQQMCLFHQPHNWKVMSQQAPNIPTCPLPSRTMRRQCSTTLSMARSVRSWLMWNRANCLTPASIARLRASR